ncbi:MULTISPECIES: GntR family transcriptional regulator [Kosmotoga]|uniref:Transcriptional regulator, GntR family n=1 Tax=Kosmotoga olearia (strain ATCC BAA-1733 / DSM 21960 / TBF 19.5.1) TaxID=521045 RepID=C5CH64_KOSOT|nr:MULTISPECIES: GntR family transcriptional regulator [Kosmotoga]ACR80667.1 transcriptional regulator, GntR family [Kosmotoga olearia TBF 19.5.1]MDI3495366.1 GntR family transcriptional regulator, N-acetylglucosamine utilization regulator [Pseudothermotoga sp.]OAA19116.1 GntR family transcriptional regulator [Kosmotoga sp. DU53]
MREAPVPLHYQIYLKLRENIENGIYKRGDQLPTEKEICEMFNVSRTTVRRALEELKREGIIERIKGKGTFITLDKKEEQLSNLTGFSEEAKLMGMKAHSKVITNKLTRIPLEAKEVFDMPGEGMVVLLKRIRFLDNEPYAIEWAYLNPNADIRVLNILEHNMEKESLYGILKDEFGISLSHAEEIMELIKIDGENARYLNQDDGECAILRRRYTYTSDGKCIEYVLSIYRGDKYKFKVVRRT